MSDKFVDQPVLIRTIKLFKIYKKGTIEVTALRGVNLRIYKNEFLSIIGPSGSGKSSLLSLLGGISTPSAGVIFYNDLEISTFNSKKLNKFRRENIGFLWKNDNLLPTYSIIDNLKIAIKACGKFNGDEVSNKCVKILEDTGLTKSAKKKPNELSILDQQKASVALAVANEPELILADEPTGELDSEETKEFFELLCDIHKKYEITIVIGTHDENIKAYSTRFVTMHDGIVLTKSLKNGMEVVETDKDGELKIPVELQQVFGNKRVRVTQVRDGEIKLSLDK